MNSEKYLAYVRTLPCCHCRAMGADPHHIIGVGMGIMGGKAPDFATMPLCRACHVEVHKAPDLWPQTKWMIQTMTTAFIEGKIKT